MDLSVSRMHTLEYIQYIIYPEYETGLLSFEYVCLFYVSVDTYSNTCILYIGSGVLSAGN